MLFFWFIWSRFFFFALNDEKPWKFCRYRIFRSFFNDLKFSLEQLNPFQKRFLGLFFTYYNFLPISFYFVDSYTFTMCRPSYSKYGYLLLSHEALKMYDYTLSNNLMDFSSEFKILKKFKLFNKFDTDKYSFVRYKVFNSYFKFYMYYLQAFFELDSSEDKIFTPHSLILLTTLAIKRSSLTTKLTVYNLNKIVDFYAFMRNIDRPLVNFKPKIRKFTYNPIKIKFYEYIIKLKQTYIKLYQKRFKVRFFFLNKQLHKALVSKYNSSSYFSINKKFKENLQNSLFIRFSDSSVSKYIPIYTVNRYKLYFLRKNRIFNKSRYSRNRQLYRTGVFWCLWLNIIIVYGLYFFFYRFTLNFGYMWLLLFIFFSSFILSRIFQSKLYSLSNLYLEFYNFYNFIIILFSNLKLFFVGLYTKFFMQYINLVYKQIVTKTCLPIFYNSIFYKIFIYYQKENQLKRIPSLVYVWTYYVGKDDSYWQWRTKLYWFEQFWKMLIQQ